MLGGLLRLGIQIGGDIEEQIVTFRDDLCDAGIRTIGLVDHQDHRQVCSQRLAQHEPSLRQWAFGGIDQQQDPVDHGESAFHLTAEVGVARGVDDVDHGLAAVGVTAMHGGVLGQDRDALFLLQITGVHQSLHGVVAAVAQRPGLSQHRIDQGRFSVVDVRDDGDVSEFVLGVGASHSCDCRSVGAGSRKRVR